MNKDHAKEEIDALIDWISNSREKINLNDPINILWYFLLGSCFIINWWQLSYTNESSKLIVWLVLVIAGWGITMVWLKKNKLNPSKVSTPLNQFIGFWLIQGTLMSMIGFGSMFDMRLFFIYPFIFGLLMSSVATTIQLILKIKNLRPLAIFWLIASWFSLFLDDHMRFFIVGIACWLSPIVVYTSIKLSKQS